MLILAVALVAAGVLSPSFLLFAVVCTAMMALMMRGMHGGAKDGDAHDGHPGGPRAEPRGHDHTLGR